MWEGVIKCLVKPKTVGILFRKTFPELEMSLVRRFLEKCPKELFTYDSSRHIATFLNGSILQFAYCDTPNDVYRYQSAEFDFIGIDELTHFTEYVFTYLLSRLRTVKAGFTPSFFAATNPGNVGHAFVKARWVTKDSKEPGYRPEDYDFIPATLNDNPILMKNDPEYVRRLESLPEHERKMLLEGSFDVYVGQFFGEFDERYHVCDPFMIPEHWRRMRSIDHGRTSPTACLWVAIDERGGLWVYREYYKTNTDADVNALSIFELSASDPRYWFTVLDSACWAHHGGETIAEIYERNGVSAEPSEKKREAGWALMHEFLRVRTPLSVYRAELRLSDVDPLPIGTTFSEGFVMHPPKIHIFRSCVNFIRELKDAIIETKRDGSVTEDVSDRCSDHALDSVRYMLQHMHEGSSRKKETFLEKLLRQRRDESVVGPATLNKFYSNKLR